jgi:hypothetical protein
MSVEQPQLLAAMHGIERVVEVKDDPLGNAGVGPAIKIDHGFCHAQKRAQIGPVLKARQGWLRSQVRPGGQNVLRQLECRIGPHSRGVVAVLVTGSDHEHPEPDHLGKAVDHLGLRARILDAARQLFGDAKALFDLP